MLRTMIKFKASLNSNRLIMCNNTVLLKLIGICGNKFISDYTIFNVLMFLVAFVLVPQIMYTSRKADDILEITETIAPALSNIMLVTKYVIAFVHRKKLRIFLENLQETYNKYRDSKFQDILATRNTEANRVTFFYLMLMLYSTVNYAWMPLIVMWYKKANGIPIPELALPFKVDYIISYAENPIYSVIYVITIVNMTALVIIYSAVDCLFVSCCLHVEGNMKIVRKKVENIGKIRNTDISTLQKDKTADERLAIVRLNSCIVEHNEVIQRVAKMEDIFSMQCMIQFLSSSLTICIILFQASVNLHDIKKLTTFVGFLAGVLVQLFMFAKYGQRLLNQSVRIAVAAYGSPWYSYGQRFRKPLRLLIQRSQSPLGISAKKFYFVSIQSFSKIISASASYFTLLQTVNDKKKI